MPEGKKRIMRSLKIQEISAVDRPAQEEAKATILKRDDGTASKRAALTTSDVGHTHTLNLEGYDGESNHGQTSYDKEHSHPWVMAEDGTIVIGEAMGHTHQVDVMSKTGTGEAENVQLKEEKSMAKTVEELQAEIETLKAAAKTSGDMQTKMDEMQRKLDEANKTIADMKEKAKKSAAPAEEDIVFKSSDGSVFTKSDDPRTVEMAKRLDEQLKINKRNETEALIKSEFSHLPGELEAQVALFEAIGAIIDEEQRTAVKGILKAHSAGLASVTTEIGHQGGAAVAKQADGEDASTSLDALVAKYAEEHSVGEPQAFDAVLKTEEGMALYAKANQ